MSRRKSAGGDGVFWISYSDLSTALLAVFILAIALMIDRHGQEQQVLLDQVEDLQSMRQQLAQRLNEAKNRANQELDEEVFGFDPENQTVFVIDTTWFDPGQHDLSLRARRSLAVFYPHLYDAIFHEDEASGDKPADYLLSIELQGHTDPSWRDVPAWSWDNYRENAALSRMRAAAIATYLGNEFHGAKDRPWLQFFGFVETSGRSWTQSKCNGKFLKAEDFRGAGVPCVQPSRDDEEKSRRVTFGFRLDDLRLLEEIEKTLRKQREDA